MSVGNDNIRRVLSAFEQGDWDEIHLVAEGIELHLSTAPDGFATQTWDVSVGKRSGSADDDTSDAAGRTRPARPVPPAKTAAADDPGQASAEPGTVEVVAPSPGIFWRSPLPGAPPFADLDSKVGKGDVLCIVEVMKLMNHITATVSGTVTQIAVGNGESVARGQVLFRIRPDGA